MSWLSWLNIVQEKTQHAGNRITLGLATLSTTGIVISQLIQKESAFDVLGNEWKDAGWGDIGQWGMASIFAATNLMIIFALRSIASAWYKVTHAKLPITIATDEERQKRLQRDAFYDSITGATTGFFNIGFPLATMLSIDLLLDPQLPALDAYYRALEITIPTTLTTAGVFGALYSLASYLIARNNRLFNTSLKSGIVTLSTVSLFKISQLHIDTDNMVDIKGLSHLTHLTLIIDSSLSFAGGAALATLVEWILRKYTEIARNDNLGEFEPLSADTPAQELVQSNYALFTKLCNFINVSLGSILAYRCMLILTWTLAVNAADDYSITSYKVYKDRVENYLEVGGLIGIIMANYCVLRLLCPSFSALPQEENQHGVKSTIFSKIKAICTFFQNTCFKKHNENEVNTRSLQQVNI